MVEFSLAGLPELIEAMLANTELTVGPANFIRQVAPNDDLDLPDGPARSFYVGLEGWVRLRDQSGNVVEMYSNTGQYHPIKVTRILATGTTAMGIIAIY